MSSFRKNCIYCDIEIELSDKDGRWKPYSTTTGKIHDCPDKRNRWNDIK